MKSTIPAPGPDCTAEARSASVTGALCARMRREQETLDAAIRTLTGERAPSERDPEPYRPRLMPLACNCGETGHVQCDMHGPRE